jgi:prepilin-type N-terminal cleavage/methylation domain-containing protein
MKKSGFTLVEIMIVVAIIGLLAAIAIPSFMKSRAESQAKACINNIRQISAGKEQAATTLGWTNGMATTDAAVISNIYEWVKGGTNVTCPAGKTAYTLNAIGADPTCGLGTLVSGPHTL